jgi:hypothetical protein
MKIAAFYSEEYERLMIRALKTEAKRFGVGVIPCTISEWKNQQVRPRSDGAIIISMTANRQPIWEHYRGQGKPVIYMDKGYVRLAGDFKTMFWRMAVNDLQPIEYLRNLVPEIPKWRTMGQPLLARHSGPHVCVAGSTNRYHSWYGLPKSQEWAHQVVDEVRRHWSGPILWRPKPSLFKRGLAFTVPGTILDDTKHGLETTLSKCRLLVTHGSAVGCNAIWAGVPATTLGPGVAWDVSSRTVLEGIERPRFPTEEERLEWCGRLAAVQFTVGEMERGAVWKHFFEVLELLK